MSIQPFKIAISDEALEDLKARLARTRWPDQPEDAGWSMGTNLDYLKDLVAYWQNEYDWREHEARLNTLEHFKAELGGVGVHFIHERGKGPNPLPIILTHGWPDSFYRFHKIIPMLTDPAVYGGKAEDAFDVIVPSIPGFGFSERTAMTSSAVADLWAKLMSELGYERFVAGGGDGGSIVSKALATRHPERISALHLTDVGYPTGQEDVAGMTEAEQQFVQFVQNWWFHEGAYSMVHATKPQTVAFSFNDSPVGLASWMLSMIHTGADGDRVEEAFGSRDDFLTNLMLYWATETVGSAARMALEETRAAYANPRSDKPTRSGAPTGIALFPREAPFPREWAERSLNVQRFTQMPEGGHFAPLEVPELFVQDLREFLAPFRQG